MEGKKSYGKWRFAKGRIYPKGTIICCNRKERRKPMKKRLFAPLLSVYLLGFSGQADAQSKAECYKMKSVKDVKEISVEKTLSDSKGENAFYVFDGIEIAFGVSVSMEFMKLLNSKNR